VHDRFRFIRTSNVPRMANRDSKSQIYSVMSLHGEPGNLYLGKGQNLNCVS